MATILITGGSGLIGRALTRELLRQGHTVRHLGRTARAIDGVASFIWNVEKGLMDERALHGVDHIVHLAGAGIADKRWTPARVRELTGSRAASALLLLRTVKAMGTVPKSLVSAAGINFYGAMTSGHVFVEDDPPGNDAIGRISREWEEAVGQWSAVCRTVRLRTPVVLSPEGGPLAKLALPVRFGLGAPLGSGKQWMTWVHIDDLVAIHVRALTDGNMAGAYNVSSGDDVTNATFMRTLARVLRRPFLLPPVPAFMLRAALGDMASILLEGSRASNARLLATGFRFGHPRLEGALHDLLGRRHA